MIKGIGCDIVAIDRIAEKVKNEKFLDRVFTDEEKKYITSHSVQSAAGIWASKEAVSKALGSGFLKLRYKDVEILHTEQGQPYVNLSKIAKSKMQKLSAENIQLSISHEGNQALAFVVLD
ncbi:MAG: holo-ACP synthase [Clostridia bacterium]|nr:holo-ACP synthase [Clostridia bacterium]